MTVPKNYLASLHVPSINNVEENNSLEQEKQTLKQQIPCKWILRHLVEEAILLNDASQSKSGSLLAAMDRLPQMKLSMQY